jgi:hypothetical protein
MFASMPSLRRAGCRRVDEPVPMCRRHHPAASAEQYPPARGPSGSPEGRVVAVVAVIVTAVATFIAIVVLDLVAPDLGFLVEGAIAVLIGAAVGLTVPWYMARQRRANR